MEILEETPERPQFEFVVAAEAKRLYEEHAIINHEVELAETEVNMYLLQSDNNRSWAYRAIRARELIAMTRSERRHHKDEIRELKPIMTELKRAQRSDWYASSLRARETAAAITERKLQQARCNATRYRGERADNLEYAREFAGRYALELHTVAVNEANAYFLDRGLPENLIVEATMQISESVET